VVIILYLFIKFPLEPRKIYHRSRGRLHPSKPKPG